MLASHIPHESWAKMRTAGVKLIIDPAVNWGKYPIITGSPAWETPSYMGDTWPFVNHPPFIMVNYS